jgi:hypothetical protein
MVKNPTEIKSEVNKMSQPLVGQNYSGLKCHTVTNHPFLGQTNSPSTLGQNVTVLEGHSSKLSQWIKNLWTFRVGRVGLWVDVMSRHRVSILTTDVILRAKLFFTHVKFYLYGNLADFLPPETV